VKSERTVGSSAENEQRIALGFKHAAERCGVSVSFLRKAAVDPNPDRRLKTVRLNRRRLIRQMDLQEWFNRVVEEDQPDDSKAA
jgi:hypothetical protein